MAKYKVAIFDRKTRRVEEVKELDNLRGFMVYWSMQADSANWGYRVFDGNKQVPEVIERKVNA